MNILLILLSVMTFTVESKNSVSMEGSWPYDIGVVYACDYQKGSVRAGDKATLSLSGLELLQLQEIKVYVRSNKNAGAGTITMKADGTQFFYKEGTYKDWFGAYDNTNYKAVTWKGTQDLVDGSLVIEVAGTESSLHVEKFEIAYVSSTAPKYTVTLVSDGETQQLTEETIAGGVVLPNGDDKDGWYFAGWSPEAVSEPEYMQPYMLDPGTRYYPKKNTTFWAVYTDVAPPTWDKQAQPQSGYYMLELHGLTLTGEVENGYVAMYNSAEMVYSSDLYYIDFNTTDETCMIKHYSSGSFVGYNTACTKLTDDASAWRYRMVSDSTWMFIAKEEGEEYWMLFRHYEESEAWLSNYNIIAEANGLWALYALPDPNVPIRWWSFPKTHCVEEVKSEEVRANKDWVIPFGNYDLIIHNGVKELKLKE